MDLILASSSPYRKALLRRLGMAFECVSPKVDESPKTGESPAELVSRLAAAKAYAVAAQYPGRVVIGADQVAVHGDKIVGKPGDHRRAVSQLRDASGQTVLLVTGLCVIAANGNAASAIEPYRIHFRALDDAEIESYLNAEQPYDCAGSVKVEGLGIALLERMEGDDPSAIIGLPLIRLCTMLRAAGIDPLSVAPADSDR